MGGVINFVAYQAVWFAVVASAAHGRAALGMGAAALFAAAQLALSRRRLSDVRLMAAAVSLGVAIDGTLRLCGWLRYASPEPALPPHGAPLWILCLWAAFALTLTRSLAWLMRRPWLAALLGALGGPLAYASAARGFAAVELAPPVARALGGLALGWGAALAVLAYLARRGHPGDAATLIEARP
jgi:hypothetical protein